MDCEIFLSEQEDELLQKEVLDFIKAHQKALSQYIQTHHQGEPEPELLCLEEYIQENHLVFNMRRFMQAQQSAIQACLEGKGPCANLPSGTREKQIAVAEWIKENAALRRKEEISKELTCIKRHPEFFLNLLKNYCSNP